METLGYIVLFIYFGVLLVLSFYGSHRYWLAWLCHRHRADNPTPRELFSDLPHVTVQLPVFNERYVVERLIETVCRLDYPADRFEVQVLDDSTDDTTDIARRAVERCRSQGVDIVHIHRTDRTGYKAGALENGQRLAKGELVAVFDADFTPEPNFLKDTVHHFSDPGIGMVQVRWGHLNREYSLLTEAQSILLDGHFVIEHNARHRHGCFFNFNGTAGVWRKSTIEDAGGWEHDTLTEDMDLSYRAQLKGWRFIYLNDVVSPAEVPVEMNAFKTQQHRWSKGSIQTARKMLPTILRSKLPFRVKLEAWVHLTANIAYLLMVALGLLLPFSIIIRVGHGWRQALLLDIPAFMAATVSVCSFYMLSQRVTVKKWYKKIPYLPFVLALGIGMSLNNAKAVLEALFNHQTGFTRTPKYAVTGKSRRGSVNWKKARYVGRTDLLPLLEVFMGVYFSYSLYLALQHRLYLSVPFLVLFQFGYLYVGFMSLFQTRMMARKSKAEEGDLAGEEVGVERVVQRLAS